MKCFEIPEKGKNGAIVDRDAPEAQSGQYLIDVTACGLNFADLLMGEGKYQERLPFPLIPGMEVAGVVRAVGKGVDPAAVGQRVAAFCGAGGLAEQVAVPAERCLPVPEDMTDIEAAGFQIAYGTSHVALDHLARLKPGETLVVTGAAGGVGLTAVEIGALMGAKVVACARGADKLRVAQEAGAHHLLDSDTADLRAEIKALGGADVVYDAIGGEQFDAILRATNPGARLLPIGFAGGAVPQIPANYLLVKNLTVFGFYWGGYLKLHPEVVTGSMSTLMSWFAQGRLRPVVSQATPLPQAAQALDDLRARRSTGKVVITVNQSG
ncbi:hypothetical protein ACMU_05890 [Actibacterium mucosum KCTC 23349]|uniref:Enoyl reductase (ER) domain-containing protein n=1 Tax=Actibacterium mucosum KCTC 23349 TaxID=1454373 RepID=A0A037ZK49_9RHOB|nr:NADPH:quinone oxidoreductase family protein [Actibacterium mucosum]KAJ56473.1 hypothetical protein ACMU_05890 [Actibacterium mucosum KCTC 23349]